MESVRLTWRDRAGGHWLRRNWFPLGWAVFGIVQSVVVGQAWPGVMFSANMGLYMVGEGVARRRRWVVVDAEGISWRRAFRRRQRVGWTHVDRVWDLTRKTRTTMRSMHLGVRGGGEIRLPLPYANAFFDPDRNFDRSAALLKDLVQRHVGAPPSAARR